MTSSSDLRLRNVPLVWGLFGYLSFFSKVLKQPPSTSFYYRIVFTFIAARKVFQRLITSFIFAYQ